MWNDIKSNLNSAKVFLPEFLIFDAIFIAVFVLIIEPPSGKILFVLFIIILTFLFLNIIGAKRLKELDEIKRIVSDIRNNNYKTAEEIHLSSNLRGMEEEIKEMFNKARSDVEYLKRLERIRTEFLGNVSHELRTPIFSIQGYIETLLNGAIKR